MIIWHPEPPRDITVTPNVDTIRACTCCGRMKDPETGFSPKTVPALFDVSTIVNAHQSWTMVYCRDCLTLLVLAISPYIDRSEELR